MAIPVYMKTDPDSPRPTDSEFYWMTQGGMYLCRNHTFFSSDVPTNRNPRGLAPHKARCVIHYPKLGVAALEYIVGYFHKIFELYGSEAIVLLVWDMNCSRYRLHVPPQEIRAWETYNGLRTAIDVSYETPMSLPPGQRIVGDIHSHGDHGAFSSWTDKTDETHRDGIHAVIGRIDRDPPEFHIEIAIDGFRFSLKFDQIFKGYHRRRTSIPQSWIDQVKLKIDPPWPKWNTGYSTSKYSATTTDDGWRVSDKYNNKNRWL